MAKKAGGDTLKPGVWNLDSPGGLLVKLRNDLKRMEQEPCNPEPAYDFFVTAYHMHEWLARDPAHRVALESDPLVLIAGEIATRAKHARAENSKWVTLLGMGSKRWGPLMNSPLALPSPLWVMLKDPASTPLGKDIVGAVELGQCLVDHWERVLNDPTRGLQMRP